MKIETISENGKKLCLVPVGKDAAQVWADDLSELLRLGVSLSWHMLSNTVRVCGRRSGHHLHVGRLIADAKAGQIVRHKNGNNLDLRRENLILLRGFSRKRDRDNITPLDRQRRPLTPDQLMRQLELSR